jgi:hypothetical protein
MRLCKQQRSSAVVKLESINSEAARIDSERLDKPPRRTKKLNDAFAKVARRFDELVSRYRTATLIVGAAARLQTLSLL